MRVEDYGKVAATFIDTQNTQAVRIAPHPQSRNLAQNYAPDTRSRWHTQLEGYQIMPLEELLVAIHVQLNFDSEALIGRAGARVNCDECGEEIINGREVLHDGHILCQACNGTAYYYSTD